MFQDMALLPPKQKKRATEKQRIHRNSLLFDCPLLGIPFIFIMPRFVQNVNHFKALPVKNSKRLEFYPVADCDSACSALP